MNFDWRTSSENLDWEELSTLYRIAPLGEKPAERLKIAFANSMYQSFVYHNGKLAAAGRCLADGVDCAYLCDIAVHPDYQGAGLGKALVARLLDNVRGYKKVILYAAAGKEPFYKKFGFRRMTTAMAIFQDEERAIKNGVLEADQPGGE